MSIAGLLKKLESIHGSKPENIRANCDTLVKTLTSPRNPHHETGYILFSMNLIPFQNNMTQTLCLHLYFCVRAHGLCIQRPPLRSIHAQGHNARDFHHCAGKSEGSHRRTPGFNTLSCTIPRRPDSDFYLFFLPPIDYLSQ